MCSLLNQIPHLKHVHVVWVLNYDGKDPAIHDAVSMNISMIESPQRFLTIECWKYWIC